MGKVKDTFSVLRVEISKTGSTLREASGDWDRGEEEFSFDGVTVYADTSDCEYDRGDVSTFYPIGTAVFVLIEEYSTGDTFGRTTRDFSVKGVYDSYEKAERAARNKKRIDGFFDKHIDWRIEETVVKKKKQRATW